MQSKTAEQTEVLVAQRTLLESFQREAQQEVARTKAAVRNVHKGAMAAPGRVVCCWVCVCMRAHVSDYCALWDLERITRLRWLN